jgi:hypothetical protein
MQLVPLRRGAGLNVGSFMVPIINQVGMGAVQRLNVVDTSRVKLRLVW